MNIQIADDQYTRFLPKRPAKKELNVTLAGSLCIFKSLNGFFVGIYRQKPRPFADRREHGGMTSCIAGEHSFCLYGGIQSLQVHIEVPGTIHPIFRCRANLMLPHIKPRFFRQGHQQLTRGCPRRSFHHRSKEAALLSKHGAACVYALLIREVTGVLPKHSG